MYDFIRSSVYRNWSMLSLEMEWFGIEFIERYLFQINSGVHNRKCTTGTRKSYKVGNWHKLDDCVMSLIWWILIAFCVNCRRSAVVGNAFFRFVSIAVPRNAFFKVSEFATSYVFFLNNFLLFAVSMWQSIEFNRFVAHIFQIAFPGSLMTSVFNQSRRQLQIRPVLRFEILKS